MPKKTPKNAYYYYMLNFKEEQRLKGVMYKNLAEVAEAANPSWRDAPRSVRAKFEAIAKNEKNKTGAALKLTSLGEPIEQVEQRLRDEKSAEEQEKKDIKNIVKLKAFNDSILTENFFVMDVNYYCVVNDKYIICEFSMVRFNLRDGILDEYHEIVNPGSIPTGYSSDAKIACDELGMELPDIDAPRTNYILVLANIRDYLRSSMPENAGKVVLPPLFTMPNKVAPVQNFIYQMCLRADEDESIFKVYKVNTLFYTLINAVSRHENEGFPKESLALTQLNKDVFQYNPGLGCRHHEQGDKYLMCTTSRCKRWVFTALDQCCPTAGVEMLPGAHLPADLDVNKIIAAKEQRNASARAPPSLATMHHPAIYASTPPPPTSHRSRHNPSSWASIVGGDSDMNSSTVSSTSTRPARQPVQQRLPKSNYAQAFNIRPAPNLTEENISRSIGRGRNMRAPSSVNTENSNL